MHVRAEALDPAALLAALKAGHYYSSTGPEIYSIRRDGKLTISPASKVLREVRLPRLAGYGCAGLWTRQG